MGGKIDLSLNKGNSPPIFRLHGQNCHLIGSLMPTKGCLPKFAQLYIYDTENEIHNRILSVRERNDINKLHAEIVADIKTMLDDNNVLVKSFRMVRDKIVDNGCSNIKLKLIGRRGKDARKYNLPSISEVVALVVGDLDESLGDRDIIVETLTGELQRINDLHASYLAIQYPQLFPYGEDGYTEDISFSELKTSSSYGRKIVSPREYFAYRLHEAKDLTYAEFPIKFVWRQATREWVPRKMRYCIGRIFYLPSGSGEMYYLRCLLNIVREPTCYEDIRCVDGVQYDTFRDACYALGLLDDDREYIDGIIEASHWASSNHLRNLFVTLLSSDSLCRPEIVWENCWNYLSDDILYHQQKLLHHPELELNDEHIKSYTLVEIEKLLQSIGRSLHEFESLPFPDFDYFQSCENKLIIDKLRYDHKLLEEQHKHSMTKITDEQRHVYDSVMKSVEAASGKMFFVYRYGGTGKTFLWNILSAAIISKGEIVLNVAASGIVSLLFPGGRTAHSRFKIPLNPNEDSMCNIKQGSPLAELIIRSKLIIWDEAPMIHKYCFEALDRSMRDIMRFGSPKSFDVPFGGKTIMFGGDFRQILPVIPKGTGQDVVLATMNSSYLWRDCIVLRLTKNMRLQNLGANDECVELHQFSNWISSIGDGTIGGPNDGHASIDIPEDILLKCEDDPVATIVQNIYPSYTSILNDVSYLQERAILDPTLDVVDMVNKYMISLNALEGRTYLSSDSMSKSDSNADILRDVYTGILKQSQMFRCAKS